ncbi:MAG TPA: 3-phosphoshikimate 1-carboxyvinyltransferase [Nevskiaceae bacterium]|nr:3-phosphoshikimate 1-carboxyvinyltransferase [Nevskiaceae bacterium]
MTGHLSFVVAPGGALRGRLRIPGDKSISHRAVMFGAIAEGVTEVSGFLDGADCLATMRAFRAMGVQIDQPGATHLIIHGVGPRGLRAATGPLELGNSGTSMRLMTGLLAGQSFTSALQGDASLSRRPMRRVVDPLRSMGAHIQTSVSGTAPLNLTPSTGLQGIDYTMPVSSAQVKSCLLLAGLYASGRTVVHDPGCSRDHTERMLKAFGVSVDVEGGTVGLTGGQALHAHRVVVPADVSSAAFFLVGAAMTPGSDLWLEQIGINPTRAGVLEVLQRMGADITLVNQRELGVEPVADIHVRAERPLHGVDIGRDLVTLAIDEMPALFVAAACAEGTTRVSGAGELRVKESDRIATMCAALKALGADVLEQADGAVIQGGTFHGGDVQACADHRVAMSLAMAGLRAAAEIRITDCDNVATSFPQFVETAASCGLKIHQRSAVCD